MEKIRAVVFDLDGTLVDSLADIASAVNSTLRVHGRQPHPLESYKTMVGWGLRRLLETASADQPFGPDEIESAHQDLLAQYRSRPVVHTRGYDGVHHLLGCLDGRVPLGVLSNKEDGMTKTIVASIFPQVRFQAVRGTVPGKAPKPDPKALLEVLEAWTVDPACCVYLGDSAVDMETAIRAGAIPCGAAWGFRGEAELRAAGAKEIFTNPLAFERWLLSRLSDAGSAPVSGGSAGQVLTNHRI